MSSSQAPTITEEKQFATASKRPSAEERKMEEEQDGEKEATSPLSLDEKIEGPPQSHEDSPTEVTDIERQLSTFEDESRFLKGKALFLVFVGMLLSVFLVALDQTIVSPALPVIASKFNALSKIGWIASSYFLTQCSFMLLYGSILSTFDRKWIFIAAVSIFELGSLFCAVSWDVNFLIFGRAVAGVGAAGIFVSCLSIIAEVTRLEQRPMFFGAFGGVFAFASVVGPLLGGTFTSHVSWRWCFYINLPIGAITVATILLIIKSTQVPPPRPEVVELTKKRWGWIVGKGDNVKTEAFLFKVLTLDIGGVVLMLGVVTCLLLPLQWAGNQYAWSNPKIIALFCTFGAALAIFILYEHKIAGPNRLLPLEFFKSRTQIGCCSVSFFVFFGMMMFVYFLPLQYQAVKDHSAEKSGIDILPFMLGVVVFSALSGIFITVTGHYWTVVFIGPLILSVSGGLFYTVDEFSSNKKLIGFQIIACELYFSRLRNVLICWPVCVAAGIGLVLQNLIIAIQSNVAKESDVPLATALVTLFQLVGAVVGISVADTVFDNELSSGLKKYAPEAPFEIVKNDVLAIYTLPSEEIPGVVHAYVKALDYVYVIAVGLGAAAAASSFLIRSVNIKGRSMTAGAHVA